MRQKARREWQNCSGIKKVDGIDQTRRSKNLPYCIAKKLARQKFTMAFLPQFSRSRAVLY